MILSDTQGVPTGYWSGYTFDVGYTGMALLAFEIQGHTLAGDIVEDPYVETVQRGVNFLLTKMYTEPITVQLHGDPDRNGNGMGILCESGESDKIYEDAIAMLALASTGAPTQMAEVGPSEVIHRTYHEIVQDMADWLVYAQNEEGNGRGGWRREANYVESDMSTTQWPVFALQTAEVNLGILVPEWVRYELGDHFLRYVQSPDGGFGYSSPGVSSLLRTGAGLMCLAFAGVPDYDARVIAARRYIADHWDTESNVGNLYAMYDVMRGSRMPVGVGAMSPQTLFYGEHNWYEAYATHLLTHQAADGSWQDEGYGQGPIGTAWGILILSPQMFMGETKPVVDLSVTKASARSLTLAEQPVTYTIVITNSGPNTATNVFLMDTLPADVLFDQDGVISSQGDCRRRGTLMTPRFMCDLGEFPPGAMITLTLGVTPTRPVSDTLLPLWTITNTVNVAANEDEATPSDNIATAVISVTVPQADLEISKMSMPDPVAVGRSLSYTLSIVNHGPDYAREVVVTDVLPISVTMAMSAPFGTITSSQGDCGNLGTFIAPLNTFACDLGGLAGTARATVTLVVTPTAVGVVTNTAHVSAETYDPITITNQVMQRTVIQRAASLVYLPVVMRQY
jgi:uncharacterized repeat protein (TIGR01451 family)